MLPYWVSRKLQPTRWLTGHIDREFAKYRPVLKEELKLSRRRPAVLDFLVPFVVLIALQVVSAVGFAESGFCLFGRAFGLNDLLDIARTCGTVLAALAGILITILVFALQIQSSRLPGASRLLLAFAKREMYLPILGFNLNTVLVCLIVVAFARPIQGPALAGLAAATFLETGAAIVFLMYLTYRTIHRVGTVSAEELLQEDLKAQHAESLIAYLRNGIALGILRNRARALGFMFFPFPSAKRDGEINHYMQGMGWVADVDLSLLQRIAAQLKLEPLPEESASAHPGPQRSLAATLSIMWGQSLSERRPTVALVTKGLPPDVDLSRDLQKLFIASAGKRPRETVEWEEFSQGLKSHILRRESSALSGAFKVFESIAEKYLDITRRLGTRYEQHTIFTAPFTSYRPPDLESLDFDELIESAAPDTDTASLTEMFQFLTRLCQIALRTGSPEYFDHVVVHFSRFYYLGSRWEKLGDEIREMVPEYFRTTSEVLDSHFFQKGESGQSLLELEPFVKSYLKAALATLRASAERHDDETWKTMLDYMNSVMESTISRGALRDYATELRTLELHRQTNAPASLLKAQEAKVAFLEACARARDWCKLCTLTAGAWVGNLVRAQRTDAQVAKKLIAQLTGYLGSLIEILEQYLFRRAESHGRRSADFALGYEYWSLERPVSGRVQMSWGSAADDWLKPFWACMALVEAAKLTMVPDPARIRPLCPLFRTEASRQLKSEIETFIAASPSYAWLLGDTDLAKGKATFFQLLDGFAEKQERRWREDLARAPLCPQKVNHFKRTCVEGYEKERGFAKLIRHFGQGSGAVPECDSERRRPTFVPLEDKTLFAEGPYYGSLAGESVGEFLAKTENVLCSGRVEERLQRFGTTSSFTELRQDIRNAAAGLRSRGFAPNIVLVPQDDRFHEPLTNVPEWRRKPTVELEPSVEWVCEFDQMEVYAWPHTDAKSVAIVDLQKFCGIHEGKHFSGSPLKFDFRDPTDQEIQGWVAAQIRDPGERHRRDEEVKFCESDVQLLKRTNVILEVVADAYLQVIQPSAGLKLEIDVKNMGFVFAEGAGVFHRLDCVHAKDIHESNRRYCETLCMAIYVQHLGPCDVCQPNLSAFWGT